MAIAAGGTKRDRDSRYQLRNWLTQRSVRTEVLIFFGLGIGLLLYFFGYVSTKEPVKKSGLRSSHSVVSWCPSLACRLESLRDHGCRCHGVHLVTQRPPARIVVHADLSCEAPFYTRGARGSEGFPAQKKSGLRSSPSVVSWCPSLACGLESLRDHGCRCHEPSERLYQGTSCAVGSESHGLVNKP
jgi:hypothetical protein